MAKAPTATFDRALLVRDPSTTGSLSIDTGSVDTKQKRRDQHLRSADFFDVAHHPTIDVNANDVRPENGSAAMVQADVVAAGIARTMQVDADIALSESGRVATVDTTVINDRTSFGMTWNPRRAAAKTAEVSAHLVFRHTDETESS
jgi:polyisoprenoid-binding protein YceI